MNKFDLLNAIKELEVNEVLQIKSNNNFLWGIQRVELFDNDHIVAVGLWNSRPELFDFDYCAVSQANVIDMIVDYMEKEENAFNEVNFNLDKCYIA